MLGVALERESEGDLSLSDLGALCCATRLRLSHLRAPGDGLPLRPHCFDGAVSISAVQWLCNADKAGHEPRQRLKRFFSTLYRCLCRGARAVLQLYPSGPEQAEMITGAALRAGFSGGLVVDFPNSTRAKKYFLVLMAGASAAPAPLPRGLDGEEEEGGGAGAAERVDVTRRAAGRKARAPAPQMSVGSKRHPQGGKGRAWVMKKKEQARGRGVDVPADSRFTARKRKRAF